MLFGSSIGYACSCSDPSIRAKFRGYDLVFAGTVVDYKDAPQTINPNFISLATLKVDKQWKGGNSKTIDVLWGFDAKGMCNDLPLIKGERYLIYTSREKDGYGVYPECGANYVAKYHEDEIKKLDSFWFRFSARTFPFPKF